MYEINLTFQTLPKSLNKKLKWGSKYSNGRENRTWDTMVAVATNGRLPAQPLVKARIKIVRHFWQTLDYDGLVGSMKPVVDALVTAGVLIDDRWSVTGRWDIDQVFRPKKDGPLLEVHVTEATEA